MNILLVEDDKYLALGIGEILSCYGHLTCCNTLRNALKAIEENHFDLAIIDIMLDDQADGLELVKKCSSKNISSIVLSSTDDDSITQIAYKNGCSHFLRKRDYKTHLPIYIEKHLKVNNSNLLEDFFTKKYLTQNDFLIKQISDIAKIDIKNKSLLISGETGVGKSLIGRLIHELNFSKQSPLIHINCSEIPENLIESEFFGHMKGAFTGASNNREGLLQKAHNGILFLDEIGTMPLIMQQKLLKAIDEKTFTPVGSSKEMKSNFTLITATCEDLFEKIHNKEFRKDLFYRISGFHISIPPLKARTRDIDLLVDKILKDSPRKVIMTKELREKLKEYSWPGNVRELFKTLERLIAKSSGVIQEDDFVPLSEKKDSKTESNRILSEYQSLQIHEIGLKEFIKRIELEVIDEKLKVNNGKIAQTIQELGISASTFYRVVNKK